MQDDNGDEAGAGGGLTKSQKKRMKKKAKAAEDGDAANGDAEGAPAKPAVEPTEAEAAETAAKKANKKKRKAGKQTEPPSVPIDKFFPDSIFPAGEWQSYKDECAFLFKLDRFTHASTQLLKIYYIEYSVCAHC